MPNNTVIGYTYDANNRRIAKKVNGVITERFIYFSQLRPAAKVNSDSSIAEVYVYGTKENIPEYAVRDGNTYRIITDHLGSLRFVVDASDGSIKQRMAYNEFGIVTEDYIEPGFEPLPFGYAGGLYDRDTKLVKFGARDYDPETGRWISKEPLGFAGSNNFYAYVENDPVNAVDPSGLKIKITGTAMERIEIRLSLLSLRLNSNTAVDLIRYIEESDETIYICYGEKNKFNTESNTIYYNPEKSTLYDGSKDWHNRPAEIGLAHELIHAYHDLLELYDSSTFPMDEENETVGLWKSFFSSDISRFTENAIRTDYISTGKYKKLKLREKY